MVSPLVSRCRSPITHGQASWPGAPIRARLPEQIPSSQSARFLSRRTLPEVAGRSRTRHRQGRPLPALAPHPDLISNPRPRTLCRHRSITSRHWRSPRRRRLLYDCQLENPQNPLERLNTQSCSIRARRPLAHVQGESLKAGKGATLCAFPGAGSCIPWNAAQSMSHRGYGISHGKFAIDAVTYCFYGAWCGTRLRLLPHGLQRRDRKLQRVWRRRRRFAVRTVPQ